MNLVVQQRAEHPGDWHIGHLDDRPAVGDLNGNWYIVTSDAIIHNPGARLVWVLKYEYGGWECIHEMHWQDQYVDPHDMWLKETPDYVEGVAEK